MKFSKSYLCGFACGSEASACPWNPFRICENETWQNLPRNFQSITLPLAFEVALVGMLALWRRKGRRTKRAIRNWNSSISSASGYLDMAFQLPFAFVDDVRTEFAWKAVDYRIDWRPERIIKVTTATYVAFKICRCWMCQVHPPFVLNFRGHKSQ